MYFILVGTPILAFLSDGCALGNNAKTDGLNTFLLFTVLDKTVPYSFECIIV